MPLDNKLRVTELLSFPCKFDIVFKSPGGQRDDREWKMPVVAILGMQSVHGRRPHINVTAALLILLLESRGLIAGPASSSSKSKSRVFTFPERVLLLSPPS